MHATPEIGIILRMSPVTTAATSGERRSTTLRKLEPEPWGSRLARARVTRPRGAISREQASEWLASVTMQPIGNNTVGRLEARSAVPSGHRSAGPRRNAYLLTILYEIDPAELDLTDDDGPGEMAVARLRKQVRITRPVTRGYHPYEGDLCAA